jgi:hypothetical protein
VFTPTLTTTGLGVPRDHVRELRDVVSFSGREAAVVAMFVRHAVGHQGPDDILRRGKVFAAASFLLLPDVGARNVKQTRAGSLQFDLGVSARVEKGPDHLGGVAADSTREGDLTVAVDLVGVSAPLDEGLNYGELT